MSEQIETTVLEIIKAQLAEMDLKKKLSLDDEITVLGISSVNFIKIIVQIEEEYDFEFSDEDLDFRKFKTIRDIVSYIKVKLDE